MPIRRWQIKKERWLLSEIISQEAFLYLNFKKVSKPTEQEIEAQFMQARKETDQRIRQTNSKAGQSQVVRRCNILSGSYGGKAKFSDAQQYDLSGSDLWNVWSGMQSS